MTNNKIKLDFGTSSNIINYIYYLYFNINENMLVSIEVWKQNSNLFNYKMKMRWGEIWYLDFKSVEMKKKKKHYMGFQL